MGFPKDRVLESLCRNRRLYRRRVHHKLAKLKQPLTMERDAIEAAIVGRSDDRYGMVMLDKNICPLTHQAILALNGLTDVGHIENVVREWFGSQSYGHLIEVEVVGNYGLIRVQWRFM